MDDLTAMNPGRLKRKKRGSASTASVVDLPASGSSHPSGPLLGDSILGDGALGENGNDPKLPRNSLLDLVIDSKNSSLIPEDSSSDNFIQLKPEKKSEMPSPLDMLAEKSAKLEGKSSQNVMADIFADDDKLKECRQDCEKNTSSEQTERKIFAKPAPKVQNVPSHDLTKFDDLLTRNRDIELRCIDTLTRLQHTNAISDRRHKLFTAVSFAILLTVAIIGITVNVKLKNAAKNNDIKYQHEAYAAIENKAGILEAEFEKEKRGSAAAFEIYQRIEDGLFEESIEKFAAMRNEITHPAELALLEQRIDDIRWKLAENAYHDGVMLYNGENYEQARDAFFKSLGFKENTAYAPRLNYHLAMSLYQLGDFEGARRYFSTINTAEISSDMEANARFYRAMSAEKIGDKKEAYEQFDLFLKKHRYHKLADDAVRHRSKLESSKR